MFSSYYICCNCIGRLLAGQWWGLPAPSSCISGSMTYVMSSLVHWDCYCPEAHPIRHSNINQQQQTPTMLFACPHQRQQRDYTHRHALTAIVTGSISTPKEIYALTLTNHWQRRTNTQIKKISVVPQWHSELSTTVMGHIQPLQLQYIGKAPSTVFIYNIFAVFYSDMSSRYHDIILQLSSLKKLRLEILTWWSHQSI